MKKRDLKNVTPRSKDYRDFFKRTKKMHGLKRRKEFNKTFLYTIVSTHVWYDIVKKVYGE